jgi:hypothetical protein
MAAHILSGVESEHRTCASAGQPLMATEGADAAATDAEDAPRCTLTPTGATKCNAHCRRADACDTVPLEAAARSRAARRRRKSTGPPDCAAYRG